MIRVPNSSILQCVRVVFRFLFHSNFKNVCGFSLLEMVVAAGIGGMLSLALTHVFKQAGEGQQEVEGIRDELQLQKEISRLLSNKNHCTVSLREMKDANNNDVPTVFEKTNIQGLQGVDIELFTSNQAGTARDVRKFFPGKKFGRWTLNSLELVLDPSTGDHSPDRENEDIGNILVTLGRKVDRRNVSKTLSFPIQVRVSTGSLPNPRSTLLVCESEAAGSSKFSAITATPSGVAINGSLQVGAANTLTCSQTIEGIMRFVNTPGSERLEYCDGTDWFVIGRPGSLTESSSGIEVSGGIKVGTTSVACTTANEGAIRYNNTTNNIEVCFASSWGGFNRAVVHASGQDCFPYFGQANAQNHSCPTGYNFLYPKPHPVTISDGVYISRQFFIDTNNNTYGRYGFCCK